MCVSVMVTAVICHALYLSPYIWKTCWEISRQKEIALHGILLPIKKKKASSQSKFGKKFM